MNVIAGVRQKYSRGRDRVLCGHDMAAFLAGSRVPCVYRLALLVRRCLTNVGWRNEGLIQRRRERSLQVSAPLVDTHCTNFSPLASQAVEVEDRRVIQRSKDNYASGEKER